MKRNDLQFFSRLDLLFIVTPIFIAFFIAAIPKASEKNGVVKVYISGELVYEQPLTRTATWVVKNDGEYLSTLVVDGSKEKVRLVDSNCPLKICERTGWVGIGGSIVCVPNKIVVKVEGKTKASEIDIVTW
ncbi:MAG: NusG domain II-containing protein [Thermotogae bacterium]|nr:NusG domain II-containing protein [Thermotogota bacterium]